jgi:site-specific DNA recombinase
VASSLVAILADREADRYHANHLTAYTRCMAEPKIIRYAIYTRQSVDGLFDFSSCEAQFMTCREFVQASGEDGSQWIGERLDDEGYSGATLDRPAMRKLRKLIDLRGIQRLYVVALDRLSRSVRDVATLLDEMDRAGVELQIVHQPKSASRPHNRLIRHVLATFAEFEREMIAARIAESRAYLKKHGRRLAGPPPFGYDADPITKQLVPNRREARRVRLIFQRAARGQMPAQIAARINHLKWRTKQRLARRSSRLVGGAKWTPRMVTLLLRNPVYLGKFADGKATRPGCHQPAIDAELFEAAQAQLEQRRTTESRTRLSHGFPLRGKIVCPKCRRPLSTYVVTKPLRRGSRILRYYRCRSNAGGRAPCKGVSYPAWEVEQFVRDQLARDSTWADLLQRAAGDSTQADIFAATWRSFRYPVQSRLLTKLVETVRFRRKNTELRITYSPRILDLLSHAE